MNPLLEKSTHTHQAVPFQKIKPEHFIPAIEKALEEARTKINLSVDNSHSPTFENTIVALEYSSLKLEEIASVLFNLNHAHTNEAIQEAAREIAPQLTEFSNDIHLNPKLWEKVKTVYQSEECNSLEAEQKMLLEKTYKAFVRSGANLNDAQKAEFREISTELSKLGLKFSENVLAETNAFILHLTDEHELEGLPENVIKQATKEAGDRDLPGWVFTLQIPSFMPFMKYAVNRKLREKMYMAYNQRGLQNNANDNQLVVRQIVNLRRKLAKLLGYTNYASYVLDNRMAEEPNKVLDFLGQLKDAYLPAGKKEGEELQEFASEVTPGIEIQPWDWAFYAEKLREQKYSVSDEITRPYFELNHTREQVFKLANTLYGIQFAPCADIPVYDDDVDCYEVSDNNGEFLALLYLDYFPRKGKSPGAWMTEFRDQYVFAGTDHRPHVSLVFNFPRPSDSQPSLLSYSELRTFLHEFGHALHGIFSKVNYKSLSGTSVYRDFVELPSQILENWAEQKEWLNQVAIHYKTGEIMPEHILDKLLESRNFHEAYAGARQLSFGYLDMSWHLLEEEFAGSVIDFEKEAMQPVALLPRPADIAMSPSFGHIFSGGYAAGYYGYKWAEVLDADAFSRFKSEGIFNRETAREFRDKILSKGGSKHPMQLYVDFMGREPSIAPLLERSGL